MHRASDKRRTPFVIPIALLLTGALAAQQLSKDAVVPDVEIHRVLSGRIDQEKRAVGIVVAIIDSRGERVVTQGVLDPGDTRKLSGTTIFEIGGLTSVFTALLLADMVRTGDVALSDPVSKYFPPTVKFPSQSNQQITLADLATHTSGLPLLPPNLSPKNSADPYATYTEADLCQSLETIHLAGHLGVDYQYSHMGVALLATALSRRAGEPYESLLKSRVLVPLGLLDTGITISPQMRNQFAVGHNATLEPVGYWNPGAMAGAVGLKSTALDLITFLEAALGYKTSPLSASIAAMMATHKSTRYPGLDLALGWHILTTENGPIVWDNGGTLGFRAFVGFSPTRKIGIVALSNSSSPIEDLALRLFAPQPPDTLSKREHLEIQLDPRLLAGYVGLYQLEDGMRLNITQLDGHLVAELGQQKLTLAAESSRDFFVQNVEGELTFVTDRSGSAYMLVLRQSGTDLAAKRIR